MKLSDRQWLFAQALGKLLFWATKQPGYKVTFGDARSRPGNLPRHSKRSYHYQGCLSAQRETCACGMWLVY